MPTLAVHTILLRLLTLDGFRHLRIIRIGGYAAIAFFHDRNLTGVSIRDFTVLFTHLGRLGDTRLRPPILLLGIACTAPHALDERGRTLGGGVLSRTQHRCGSNRLMHDVGNRFETRTCRATDQRGLVRQIKRIGVQSQRGVTDNRGDIIRAAGFQCHGYEPLSAFLLIGHRAEHFLDRGILEHTAQAVGAQQPTVGGVRLADCDIRMRVDIEIAQHTHNHIALRMVARLRSGDTTGIDEMLHITVIRGHS